MERDCGLALWPRSQLVLRLSRCRSTGVRAFVGVRQLFEFGIGFMRRTNDPERSDQSFTAVQRQSRPSDE